MSRKNKPLVGAFFLIALGLWFLAQNLGMNLPGLAQLWPLFIIWGGASALWHYFSRQTTDSDELFTGFAALGVGAFFLLITLNLRVPVVGRIGWADMSTLWPAFIVIGGLAFLGQFVFGGFKKPEILLFGVLALGIGLASFAFTFGFLSAALGMHLLNFWPVLLILVGLALLIGGVFRRGDR